MRRIVSLAVVCGLGLVLAGCKKPEASVGDAQTPDDYAYGGAYDSSAAKKPSESYESYPGVAAGDDLSSAYGSDVGGGRTHVVAKGDTLFSLARKYYNDQRRWRDIYDANRGTISDPNMIRVGQQLVIP